MVSYFKKPSTVAFLAFLGVYVLAFGAMFAGAWGLDVTFIQPDNPVVFAADDGWRWFVGVFSGRRFVPSDLMHVAGGMYFWQELQYALACFLAALGVVYYLRGRRVGLVARYAAGAAYGLMGYNMTLYSAGHFGWFIWLMYGPFAFGLVDRCVRKGRGRNWFLLGAVLAWASAQQPDLWMLFTALTFAYGVFCLFREKAWKRGRTWVGVAVTTVAALVVGWPQFKEACTSSLAGRAAQLEQASSQQPKKGESPEAAAKRKADERWRFCTSWSLPPDEAFEFLIPGLNGESSDPRVTKDAAKRYRGRIGQYMGTLPKNARPQMNPYSGRVIKPGEDAWMPYRQHSLFMGFVTVFFALLGLCAWRRAADVRFWAVAGIVSLFFAFGCFTPVYKLVYALPLADSVRAPVKFVHLVELCVAALAGYGFAVAADALARRGYRKGGVVLCVLALLNIAHLAHVDRRYFALDVSPRAARAKAAAEPAPARPRLPAPTAATWFTLLSVLGTVGALACGVSKNIRCRKTPAA